MKKKTFKSHKETEIAINAEQILPIGQIHNKVTPIASTEEEILVEHVDHDQQELVKEDLEDIADTDDSGHISLREKVNFATRKALRRTKLPIVQIALLASALAAFFLFCLTAPYWYGRPTILTTTEELFGYYKPHWAYDGWGGPLYWPELTRDPVLGGQHDLTSWERNEERHGRYPYTYDTCGFGNEQSPINIPVESITSDSAYMSVTHKNGMAKTNMTLGDIIVWLFEPTQIKVSPY